MRARFLVTGGEQFDDAVKRPEGARFKCAKLLHVDMARGTFDTLLEYECKGENYPEREPNSIFVSASLCDDLLYMCTSTELLLYKYPGLSLCKKVSYPFFQNLHHAAPFGEYVAVASTGLDMVVLLDKETLEPVKYINALGKDPWHKYAKNVDYRQYVTLKPHESHPNYVFELDDQLWVTRFNQMDAVCLDDLDKKMSVGVERLHDGIVEDGFVYFTSVNGCIIQVNTSSHKIEAVFDLNSIENIDGPLGWCRGLHIEEGIAYVGFTRIRQTRTRENIRWAVNMLRSRSSGETRIAAYDLAGQRKLAEMVMPPGSINAIYSILKP